MYFKAEELSSEISFDLDEIGKDALKRVETIDMISFI